MLSHRREKLAVIHIAKKDLGMDDPAYRSLLQSAAGVNSAADIQNDTQYYAVMKALRTAGYRPPGAGVDGQNNPQMNKCYALWCALADLGAVRHRNWGAMMAWMARQLGGRQDIVRKDQVTLMIEELKAWKRRVLEECPEKGEKARMQEKLECLAHEAGGGRE